MCNDDDQWKGVKWHPNDGNPALTQQQQMSWELLGWNQLSWNRHWGVAVPGVTTTMTTTKSGTTIFVPITTTVTTTSYLPRSELYMCWDDLTEDMRDGATSLGYSIQMWTDCKGHDCTWPADIPMPSAPCLEIMLYLEDKLDEDKDWVSISSMKREKLVLLGWDLDGRRWRDGQIPNSYGQPWSELTRRERDAASFLGYDVLTWDSCVQAVGRESSCVKRMVHLENKMTGWVWESLKPGKQDLLSTLGWESKTWYEGELPAVMKAEWGGLTSTQRSAARRLGYTHDTWAKCPNAECTERYEYLKVRWDRSKVGWMDMTLFERNAWQLLGSSESLWNSGNNPATMQKRWSELTPEQQVEATFLGHTEETWQGCNIDWAPRVPGNVSNDTTYVDPSGVVRARMTIDRPYSEVSGNIYGKEVATMPTSFIRVFENAVSRALFCDNPPLSYDPNTYLDEEGEPLCLQRSNFEKEKYRVRVMNVVQGSIIVDFYLIANATPAQDTSRALFEKLQRQVDQKDTSPLCHDKYFGRYARAAAVDEVLLPHQEGFLESLRFEDKRNYYIQSRACLLTIDAKQNVQSCPAAGAPPQAILSAALSTLLTAIIVLRA
jgi:hypothetical protein